MEKPPRSVAVLAFLFYLIGITSIIQLLVEYFLYHRYGLDLGVLFIFFGRGFNRRSEVSRSIVSFILGFCLVCTILGLLFCVVVVVFGRPANETISGSPLAAILALAILAVVWRELNSKRLKEWFALGVISQEKEKAFQFGTKSVLLWFAVAAVLCAAYRDEFLYYPSEDRTKSTATAEGTRMVHYGVRRSRSGNFVVVDYVVLETWSKRENYITKLRMSVSRRKREATLELLDGEVIEIPGAGQLHEIRDGKYHSIPGRITKAQLDTFLKDAWKYDTLEDLLVIPDPAELK